MGFTTLPLYLIPSLPTCFPKFVVCVFIHNHTRHSWHDGVE
jgi:hypothetical protein